MLRDFLRLRKRTPRPAGPAARPFRPRLEALEERDLLSGIQLDPGFGNGGVVVEQGAPTTFDVLDTPDNKILELRTTGTLLRRNSDGSLDTSFGGGTGMINLPGPTVFRSLALAPDGKILVAATVLPPAAPSITIDLFRLNSDGSLDAGFGNDGLAQLDPVPAPASGGGDVTQMVVQPDGKIVAGIVSFSPSPTPSELVRFNADGSLDLSFGGDGVVPLQLPPPNIGFRLNGLALDSYGRIVAMGDDHVFPGAGGSGASVLALLRFSPDGSADRTFGTAGVTMVVRPTGNVGDHGLAYAPDGSLVVAGTAGVYRFTPDGQLDPTFGEGGHAPLPPAGGTPATFNAPVVVLGNGEIIIGGYIPQFGDYRIVLAEYTADGAPDPTFGNQGVFETSLGQPSPAVDGMVLTAGGKLLVLASTNVDGSGFPATPALAQFDLGPSPPPLAVRERYVQGLYQADLGRGGSQAELDGWAGLLDGSPAAQAAVAAGIAASPEGSDHLVRSWYQTYLGRPATGGEEQGWLNQLLSGRSEEQVLGGILGSPEFFDHAQALAAGGTAQQRFAQGLYQLLLDRPADPGEVAAQVGNLAAVGQQALGLAFLQSPEYRGDAVSGYYAELLHRSAEPGAAAAWASTGLDLGAIQLGLETSPEFAACCGVDHPLAGQGSGTYSFTMTPPDVGVKSALEGTADLSALGAVSVSGYVISVGFIDVGRAGGQLTFGNAGGTVTVQLVGPRSRASRPCRSSSPTRSWTAPGLTPGSRSRAR